jgi:hypothetical protein
MVRPAFGGAGVNGATPLARKPLSRLDALARDALPTPFSSLFPDGINLE